MRNVSFRTYGSENLPLRVSLTLFCFCGPWKRLISWATCRVSILRKGLRLAVSRRRRGDVTCLQLQRSVDQGSGSYEGSYLRGPIQVPGWLSKLWSLFGSPL